MRRTGAFLFGRLARYASLLGIVIMMSLFELIDLSQSIGFRIDAQWGFFLTVHMALFGGIIYVDRPLKKAEKSVAIVLYSGFALINYLMLANQLELVQIISHQIYELLQGGESPLMEFYAKRSNAEWFDKASNYSVMVHGLMLVVVVLTVIFDGRR